MRDRSNLRAAFNSMKLQSTRAQMFASAISATACSLNGTSLTVCGFDDKAPALRFAPGTLIVVAGFTGWKPVLRWKSHDFSYRILAKCSATLFMAMNSFVPSLLRPAARRRGGIRWVFA